MGDRKDSDVLWYNDDGQNLIWNIGNDQLISGAVLPTTTKEWHLAGAGDFNRDGTSDLLWHSDTGQNLIWTIGNDQITNGASPPSTAKEWHLAGVGDFNGDHTSDILWHSDSGQNLIWNLNNDRMTNGAALPNTIGMSPEWPISTGTVPATFSGTVTAARI